MFNYFYGQPAYAYANFENMRDATADQHALIINTLPVFDQGCLISRTVLGAEEESAINAILNTRVFDKHTLFIYGKHSDDATPKTKYAQLVGLGFKHVYIYSGGLFEWLLLQNIYGADVFKTTSNTVDVLKYAAVKTLVE